MLIKDCLGTIKKLVVANDEKQTFTEFSFEYNPTLIEVLQFVSDCNYIQVMHITDNAIYIICEKR